MMLPPYSKSSSTYKYFIACTCRARLSIPVVVHSQVIVFLHGIGTFGVAIIIVDHWSTIMAYALPVIHVQYKRKTLLHTQI